MASINMASAPICIQSETNFGASSRPVKCYDMCVLFTVLRIYSAEKVGQLGHLGNSYY